MKPIQVGLLVVAGALSGALFMKYSQKPKPEPAPVTTAAPAPVQPSTVAEVPAAEPVPAAAEQPSPFPDKERERKAARKRAREPRETPAAPAEVAQNTPAPAPAAAPEPAATASPAPASQPSPAPPAPVEEAAPLPPPPPPTVTLKAGTLIPARTVEAVSSDRNQSGDMFTATLDAPLIVDGFVIAERGAKLEGRVVEADPGGRVRGTASVGIQLTKLSTSDGQRIAIQTDTFTREAPKQVKEDAAKIGAAAAIGAAIGAIAGGGKGAGIGAAVGGAAGTGGVIATRGKAATIHTETRIDFRLAEPVTITEHSR